MSILTDITTFLNKCNNNNPFLKSELVEVINDDLLIIKETKLALDNRVGILNGLEPINPKYYFCDRKGNRISQNYSSIEKLDKFHYKVSEMDFMYSLGFNEWASQYGNKFIKDDLFRFKFHYGVIYINEKEFKQIVPIVYHDIYKTNNEIIIVKCDADNKIIINSQGKFENIPIKPKFGAINLNYQSDQYGMNIIPTVCDTMTDFDIEYDGFAYVTVGNTSGYLSKQINFDRYQKYLKAYAAFSFGEYSTQEKYMILVEQAIKNILYTKAEVIQITNTRINNSSHIYLEPNSSEYGQKKQLEVRNLSKKNNEK